MIGKGGRDIAREDWEDHVFGYACLLDMVVRGREERVFRKAYDTFCPVGPWITTADEVDDPTQLEMKLWVGDELRQDANTRDLVLDIPGHGRDGLHRDDPAPRRHHRHRHPGRRRPRRRRRRHPDRDRAASAR